MAKLYGKELAESIKKDIERMRESINNRYERIEKGWTDMDDCFLSDKVEHNAINEMQTQIKILEGDGLMEIDILIDADGNEIETRWVNTQWGSKIVGNGIFANSKKALIKKTGWTEGTKKVPCWTKFVAGSGGGMCSVFTGSYQIVRWHTNMVTGEYIGF